MMIIFPKQEQELQKEKLEHTVQNIVENLTKKQLTFYKSRLLFYKYHIFITVIFELIR